MKKPSDPDKPWQGLFSSISDLIPWLDLGATIKGICCFLVGLIGALIVGWVIFPMALYSSQPQPINFDHALHLSEDVGIGMGEDSDVEACLYCHAFREDGTFVGIPKLMKCRECHDDPEYPLGETEAEKEFLKRYVATDEEIPWLVYSKQPDCVYFSQIAHGKMGELECRICHGDHGQSKTLPPYKENRLTGYSMNIWGKHISGIKFNTWDRMKMDDCAECHTERGREENNACFVCHK